METTAVEALWSVETHSVHRSVALQWRATEDLEADRSCAGGGIGIYFRGDNRRRWHSTSNRTAYSHLLRKNGRSTDLKNTKPHAHTGDGQLTCQTRRTSG